MPQKRTKNGLKIYWISKKLLWLYLNTLKLKNFVHFKTFYKILTKFLLWFLNHFDSLLGKKWTQLPLERIIFHWGMSKKKFQLKIPTLSKNDYSATWCPNCYNKKTTPGKLRNGHRYEKHVVFIRPTLLTVADLFKPTVIRTCQAQYAKKFVNKISKNAQQPFTGWMEMFQGFQTYLAWTPGLKGKGGLC